MSSGQNTNKKLADYNCGDSKGTIIISEELQRQIDYLHLKVPDRKEWIGILFYKLLEGDISDPSTFKVEGKHIYLMDIGSEAYTSASMTTETLLDMYDKVPGAMPSENEPGLKYGLIHSHHAMSTFFSGTDMDELHQGTPFHNYYISLIVNYDGNYKAKVAYIAEVIIKTTKEEEFRYKNVNDEDVVANSENIETEEKKALVTFDLEIVKQVQEVLVSNVFQGRFATVQTEKTNSAVKYSTYGSHSGTSVTGFGGTSEQTNKYLGGTTSKKSSEEWSEDPDYPLDTQNEALDRAYRQVYGGDEFPPEIWAQGANEDPFPEPRYLPVSKETKKNAESKIKNRSLKSGLIAELSTSDAKDMCIEWLNIGVESDAVTTRKVIVFKYTYEALEWFDSYFAKLKGTAAFEYFLDIMAKKLIEVTKEYVPELVRKRVGDLLSVYTQSFVARKLSVVVEAHPEAYKKILEIRSKKKTNGSLEIL